MIYVKAHPDLDKNRLAVMDTSPEQEKIFEGGLTIVQGDEKVYHVEETPTIWDAIKSKRLKEVDTPVVSKKEVEKK